MAFVVDSRVIFKGEISCQSVLRDNMKGKRFSVSGAEIPQTPLAGILWHSGLPLRTNVQLKFHTHGPFFEMTKEKVS